MVKPSNKAMALVALACGGSAFLFQNCSKVSFVEAKFEQSSTTDASSGSPPASTDQTSTQISPPPVGSTPLKIQIVANPAVVTTGQFTKVTVTFDSEIENVSFNCSDQINSILVASGAISESGFSADVRVSQDLHCEVAGTSKMDHKEIKASADISVDCGNQIKNTALNRCEDFKCDLAKAQLLPKPAPGEILQVPARTSERICYYVKIFNSIPSSDSNLSPTRDLELISRDYDTLSVPTTNSNPHLMDRADLDFLLTGPRVVKVSGGLNPDTPILVDNYLFYGVFPSGQDVSQKLAEVYRAIGTKDSAMLGPNQEDTGVVLFRNVPIPVTAISPQGASSISAIDLTRFAEPLILQHLDIRAEDVGRLRELSEVYLLFQ